MEFIKTSKTESEVIVSNQDIWNWIIEFVCYMKMHNPMSNDTEIVDSLLDPDQSTYHEIEDSMLSFMSKYGPVKYFPEDVNIFNESQPVQCNYSSLSTDDERILNNWGYCLEGVSQATVGIFGILGNIVAMKVFLAGGNKFKTIFYKLLVCLLFTQTCYVGFSLIIFLGQYHKEVYFFNLMFANGLYPLPSLMLHTSTILTMMIAWHRFENQKNQSGITPIFFLKTNIP